MEFTLNSPMTEEDLDKIYDVDMDNTSAVTFHTKHGKEVEFIKVVRCKDCKYYEADGPYDGWCHGWSGMIVDDGYCSYGKASLDAEGDKWI